MGEHRKICVVTGSRADYGLMHWFMKAVDADPGLTLQLIVTGSHLSARYGQTVTEIERDGFTIDARVAILKDDDSRVETAVAMGQALQNIAIELAKLSPDWVVVLGDRYEILAAAAAASVLAIPIAHIHGGEITEGAMDDAFRHAVTKLAHLHFVATDSYRARVVQMGEDPARVFVVGALGVESVRRFAPLSGADLDRLVGAANGPLFLVTYHPVTAHHGDPASGVTSLIDALRKFSNARIVITGVNADPGNRIIRDAFERFAAEAPGRISVHESLGMRGYLSVMARASVVIGNSSSGILEAPALGVPSIDIGSRQTGRLRAESVIGCDDDVAEIIAAIRAATEPEFQARAKRQNHPYGDGTASSRMIDILRSAGKIAVAKRFYDLAPQ